MKLKTLKDIAVCSHNFKCDYELKGQAIEWVKEMQQTLLEGLSIPTAIEIMTEFHNISEEDLNEN